MWTKYNCGDSVEKASLFWVIGMGQKTTITYDSAQFQDALFSVI